MAIQRHSDRNGLLMSAINGHSSPTAIEVDGIVFDMNRISKREYSRIMQEIGGIGDDDYDKALALSGSLFEKIIVSWPFSRPITTAGYADLGVMDGAQVDTAFERLGEILKEKKLARLSTFLPDTSSPSPIPLQPTNTPA